MCCILHWLIAHNSYTAMLQVDTKKLDAFHLWPSPGIALRRSSDNLKFKKFYILLHFVMVFILGENVEDENRLSPLRWLIFFTFHKLVGIVILESCLKAAFTFAKYCIYLVPDAECNRYRILILFPRIYI